MEAAQVEQIRDDKTTILMMAAAHEWQDLCHQQTVSSSSGKG
jgi:hypothetical protein